MTYEEAKAAAAICRRYALAVEGKLYNDFSPKEASRQIVQAERLANALDKFADEIDTVAPGDER